MKTQLIPQRVILKIELVQKQYKDANEKGRKDHHFFFLVGARSEV